MRKTFTLAILCSLLAAPRLARAQDVPPEVQLTPTTEELDVTESGSAIDLQNIVTSAAKSITTVQEAPAIVTIVTAEDLRLWGHRTLESVLTDIPGWGLYPAEGETAHTMTVRGQTQSMLLLHDGVSLFNPVYNVNGVDRQLPLESIKRIEVVTGPGGVLWGANSFQGIVNVVTKDADDVGGVEVSAGYGDGRGNASDLRAYALLGQSLLDGRVKLFVHGSYENYQGQLTTVRGALVTTPAPQPNGTVIYGGIQQSDQPRSFLYSVDGKIAAGPLSLYWLWEDGRQSQPTGFALSPTLGSTGAAGVPWVPNAMTDPRGVGRDSQFGFYDRFAALEYRERFGDGRLGLNTKGYVVQSIVDFSNFMFLPPSTLLPGGATFDNPDIAGYRAGMTLDADVTLPYSNRLLFGGEAFREWSDDTSAIFINPDPWAPPAGTTPGANSKLPFLCPHAADGRFLPGCPVAFTYAADREVVAVFVSDQWRPHPGLTFDAGVREQVGFGQRPYDRLTLLSGTAVWSFMPGWHLKANLSQGFRPPTFSNTNANGASVNFGGNANLKNETSDAVQGEINARVLRNIRRVRELTMRADYSYTRIRNLIVASHGVWANSGERGIHSAEFLGRLHLKGDHTLQLGYTFLHIDDDQLGLGRWTPNHWFTLDASFNLVRDRLDLASTLRIVGSAEDPNRVPGGTPYQQNGACISGLTPSRMTCGADALVSNVALDRLPAIALWNLGVRYRYEKFELTAFVYNVLDQQWFYPDAFETLSPQLETQPYPGPRRSFFARGTYRF